MVSGCFKKLQTLLDNEPELPNTNISSLNDAVASAINEISSNKFNGIINDVLGILLAVQRIGARSPGKSSEEATLPLFNAGISKMFADIFEKFHEHLEKNENPGTFNNIFLQLLETVTVLGESNKSKKADLIRSCGKPVFRISLEKSASFLQRLESVKTLNLLLEQCPAELKTGLLHEEEFFTMMSTLTSNITSIGDYEYQVAAIEFLFRIIPKVSREKIISSLFNEKKIARDILKIRDTEFETDCRCVLNSINNCPSRSTGVTSIPCCAAVLGERVLMKPSDPGYHEFWVDFNEGSRRILLFCSQDCQSQESQTADDLWDTVSIRMEEVESYDITASNGKNCLKMLLSKPASEICPSFPSQQGSEFKIIFHTRWTALSSTLRKLFPDDSSTTTGNVSFENISSQLLKKKSKTKKVSEAEEPVQLKVFHEQFEEEEVLLSPTQIIEDSQFTVQDSQQSDTSTQKKMSVPIISMLAPARTSLNKTMEPSYAAAPSSSNQHYQTADIKDKQSTVIEAADIPVNTETDDKPTPKTPSSIGSKTQKKIKTPVVTVTPPLKKRETHSERNDNSVKGEKETSSNHLRQSHKQTVSNKGSAVQSEVVLEKPVNVNKLSAKKKKELSSSRSLQSVNSGNTLTNTDKVLDDNKKRDNPEKVQTALHDLDNLSTLKKKQSLLKEHPVLKDQQKLSDVDIIPSSEKQLSVDSAKQSVKDVRKCRPKECTSKQTHQPLNKGKAEDVEIIPDSYPAREKKHEKSGRDSGIDLGESSFLNESDHALSEDLKEKGLSTDAKTLNEKTTDQTGIVYNTETAKNRDVTLKIRNLRGSETKKQITPDPEIILENTSSSYTRSPSTFYGKNVNGLNSCENKIPKTHEEIKLQTSDPVDMKFFKQGCEKVSIPNVLEITDVIKRTPSKVYEVKKIKKNKNKDSSCGSLSNCPRDQKQKADVNDDNSDELKNFQQISRIFKKGNKKKKQNGRALEVTTALVSEEKSKHKRNGTSSETMKGFSAQPSGFKNDELCGINKNATKPHSCKSDQSNRSKTFMDCASAYGHEKSTCLVGPTTSEFSEPSKKTDWTKDDGTEKNQPVSKNNILSDTKDNKVASGKQVIHRTKPPKESNSDQRSSKGENTYNNAMKNLDVPCSKTGALSKNKNGKLIKSPSQKLVYKPTPSFNKNKDNIIGNPKPNRIFLSRNKLISPMAASDPQKDPYEFEAENKLLCKPSNVVDSVDVQKNNVFPGDNSRVTNVYGKNRKDKWKLSKSSESTNTKKRSQYKVEDRPIRKQSSESDCSIEESRIDLYEQKTPLLESKPFIKYNQVGTDPDACFTFTDSELPHAFQSNKVSKTLKSKTYNSTNMEVSYCFNTHRQEGNQVCKSKKSVKQSKSKIGSKTSNNLTECNTAVSNIKKREEESKVICQTKEKNGKQNVPDPFVMLSRLSNKFVFNMLPSDSPKEKSDERSPPSSDETNSSKRLNNERITTNQQRIHSAEQIYCAHNSKNTGIEKVRSKPNRRRSKNQCSIKNPEQSDTIRHDKIKDVYMDDLDKDEELDSPVNTSERSLTVDESKENTPQETILFNFKKICEDIIAESDSCTIITPDESLPNQKEIKKNTSETAKSDRSEISWIQSHREITKENPKRIYSKCSRKHVSKTLDISVNQSINDDAYDLQNYSFNFDEEKSIKDDDPIKLSQFSKTDDNDRISLPFEKETSLKLSSSTPYSLKSSNALTNSKFAESPDISKIEIDDELEVLNEDNVSESLNISFTSKFKDVFKSGPSSGRFRKGQKGRKRKLEEISDGEEQMTDNCTEYEADTESPSKLQPRKLFKENCLRRRECPQDENLASDQRKGSTTVKLTDSPVNVPIERGVTSLIRSFGFDLHNQMKAKHSQLENLMKGTLHDTQTHVQECFSTDIHTRRKLKVELKSKIVQELTEVEKDITLLQKCEEDTLNFYKQQMESFKAYGGSQVKRLNNLQSMHDGFFIESARVDKLRAASQINLKETMKDEMVHLQKKLMKANQKREIMNVKRSLQTLIS